MAFQQLQGLAQTWHLIDPVEALRESAKRFLRVHELRAPTLCSSLPLSWLLKGARIAWSSCVWTTISPSPLNGKVSGSSIDPHF
ncbi:MAG: hypothetical protein HC794_10085 [Nitrospiraceae bacterium]|nr:hypothetical protein [Nitrospiraceae bacterium]